MFREQRAAKNQSLFREVNERIGQVNEHVTRPYIEEFVCECADDACTEQLSLTIEEYESLRGHGSRFAVRPDSAHVWPDVERIVEKNERYWVVEKVGYAASVAEKLDPRSRTRVGEGLATTGEGEADK